MHITFRPHTESASTPTLHRPHVVPTTAVALAAEFHDVTHRYGATTALEGFHLSVAAGEVVAVLGPNGAGKTTALHALLGLFTPSSGRVRVFGRDPRQPASRERIGAMLQLSGVPDTLTVREHLRLFASYYPEPRDHDEVLELVGLADLTTRLYGTLSGGQKQRLHLAVALVGDPSLLVLDEPTTGLDAGSRRAMWSIVRGLLGRDCAVVLTTHDLDEADALADRIVLLDGGRVLTSGSPAEIKGQAAWRRVRVVTSLDDRQLRSLPGVREVRRDGHAVELACTAAEPVVLALLQADPLASDLEVTGATLEDAFLALTANGGAVRAEAA